MEKLEQILHAEDEARTAVTAARAEAQQLTLQARTAATETLREGRDRVRVEAAARRDAALADAHAAAASVLDAGADEARTVLEDAGSRTGAAVSAVLEALKGR